jgi:polysaccharide transporter, PST family
LSLRRDVLSLQVLQASALVVPLVIHPWLAHALTPSGYGKLVLVSAVAVYATTLVDFGFGWTATRAVARSREDALQLGKIVAGTYAAKLFLVAMIVLALALSAIAWRSVILDWRLFACALPGVVGAALLPTWYYQGQNNPALAATCDLLARALAVPILIALVKQPADLAKAILILATGQFVGGLCGFMFLLGDRRWRRMSPTISDTFRTLRQALPIFFSVSAVTLYTTTITVMVGVLSSTEELAFFGVAQKLVIVASGIITPINQALFPRISAALHRRSEDALRTLRKAFLVEVTIGIMLALLLIMGASRIVHLLFGPGYQGAVPVVMTMAVLPILLAVASVCANLIVLPLGRDKLHLRIVLTGAAGGLVVMVPLIKQLGARGAGITVCVAETFVMLFAAYFAYQLLREYKASILAEALP